jgi:hypothetical protein
MPRLPLLAVWALCQVAHVVASVWMLLAALAGSPRAWRLAIGYDQLANAAFGGSEDETISSRAYKASLRGRRWGCVLCRVLHKLDPNHCEKSAEPDEGR